MNQVIKTSPNPYKLCYDLEMVDRPMKFTKALSQGSEASLIVLTTYFHGVSPIKLQELTIYDLTKTWTIFMSKYLPLSLPTLDN